MPSLVTASPLISPASVPANTIYNKGLGPVEVHGVVLCRLCQGGQKAMAARPTSLGLTPQLALLLPPHCRQSVGLLKLLGAHLSLALIPQLVLPMRVVTSRSIGTPRTRHELVAQPCLIEVFPSWRLRGARLCSLWPRRAGRGRSRPRGRPWHCWGWPSSCTVVIAVVWLATQRHVVQANLQQFMVDTAAGRTPLLATLLLDTPTGR